MNHLKKGNMFFVTPTQAKKIMEVKKLKVAHVNYYKQLGMATVCEDSETELHEERVCLYALALAKKIGLEKEYGHDVFINAIKLHDIGKIGIPDHILFKNGRLTQKEYEVIKNHTLLGGQILCEDTPTIRLAKEIALYHHEKWDGTGYPFGLKGKDVPLPARVCAVADVFDAMTTERPYKKAWSIDEATEEIKKESGKHFDPELIEVFLQTLPEFIEIFRMEEQKYSNLL